MGNQTPSELRNRTSKVIVVVIAHSVKKIITLAEGEVLSPTPAAADFAEDFLPVTVGGGVIKKHPQRF